MKQPSKEQRNEAANWMRQPQAKTDLIEKEVIMETLDVMRSILQAEIDKEYENEGDTI